METVVSKIDVGFSRKAFYAGTHICLVFRDEKERRKIVSKFIKSGVLDNEQVAYFADVAEPFEVVDWLESMGVDLSGALDTPSFSVSGAVETYCPDNTFSPERMWNKLKEAYNESHQRGYSNARVTGEMSWALRGIEGSERLSEYESGINWVVKTHPITAMCQYDDNKFSGKTIYKALQVHPYLVVNGQLVENPYYISEEWGNQY